MEMACGSPGALTLLKPGVAALFPVSFLQLLDMQIKRRLYQSSLGRHLPCQPVLLVRSVPTDRSSCFQVAGKMSPSHACIDSFPVCP